MLSVFEIAIEQLREALRGFDASLLRTCAVRYAACADDAHLPTLGGHLRTLGKLVDEWMALECKRLHCSTVIPAKKEKGTMA